ncbi:RNA-directed DNA polymerase from mobile element jockey, partial [Aphis craccivora]
MEDFTDSETEMALKVIKSGKAAGTDGVLPEFLKFLGPKGRNWLTRLATAAAKTSNIPKLWRVAKVIAILKHGKPANDP